MNYRHFPLIFTSFLGEINITLQKLHRAEPWLRALAGRVDKLSLDNASTTNNQLSEEEVKKEMMLQRFQEEVSGKKKIFYNFSLKYLVRIPVHAPTASNL